MRKTKRSAVVATGVVVAVAGGTAAFAAVSGWFDGSSSSASAQSAEIKPVQAKVTALGNLWPGRTVNASVTIGNFNEFKVKATTIKAGSVKVFAYDSQGAASADTTPNHAAALAACNESNAAISLAAWPGDVAVDPGTWSTSQTFNSFIGMGDSADIACSKKALVITFTLQGELVN